jgi:glycosyltransferase involved in cell wall biosynthesis
MARQWLIDAARVDSDRITVIPHGVTPQDFPISDADQQRTARCGLGLPPDGTVAAFVGRFDEPKNEGWMLDLAAASREFLPTLHVVLMGEGPREQALRRRVRSEGLSDRVEVLPFGDPLPLYHACDAILLPSSQEGFSLVNSEAMCTGRPVLRTRTAGTQEHIVEGVTGRSVPIDRDAFIEDSVRFLRDREALRRMGSAAACHVREHLTFEQQLGKTLALYSRMIHASQAR